MSLINKMLHDLEERQALAGVNNDKILGDLRAANERVFPSGPGRSALAVLPLVTTGLLLCYLGYDLYIRFLPPEVNTGNSHVINRDMEEKTGSESYPEGVVTTPISDTVDSDMAVTLKFSPRSKDTSARDNPPIAKTAAQEPEVQVNDPVPGRNLLLHIGLTELAGGSSIQVNTAAKPDYSLFVLDKPDRLLVEIKDMDMPAAVVEEIYRNETVTRLRHTTRGDTSLLIFDLNRSIEVNSTDIREMPGGGGYSLDIELLVRDMTAAAKPGEVPDNPIDNPSPDILNEGDIHRNTEIRKTILNNESETMETTLLRNGITAMRSGDITRAIDLLYQVLMKNPRHLQARETLVTILLQQRDLRGANKLLLEGVGLHPGNTKFIKLYAKHLYEEGQIDKSLAYLKQAQPAIASDPEYYALMAAVLQRRKDYPGSGEIYRRLIATRPDHGVWWMGLGISLEGMGQTGNALQAYTNARRDKTMAPDLYRFIENKIRVLGG